ncbi:hypothetical protein FHS23_001197 [Prauserella isguenensis]|uniref:Uncharacterized protein n=1 Tax=Prauserella isguenensis TaxID=1470180 RepID=A0A839RYG3_9PSEU|nr:hypothetical protein [Prauserella isguenensis]
MWKRHLTDRRGRLTSFLGAATAGESSGRRLLPVVPVAAAVPLFGLAGVLVPGAAA